MGLGIKLEWLSFFIFFLAALIHVGFFVFQTIVLQRSAGAKILRLSAEGHQAVKAWAFSQGFYNLFLAIGVCLGLVLVIQKKVMLAGILVGFGGLSMFLAGVVLWFSAPHMRKFALLQAVPPALGFVFLFFHVKDHLGY